MASPVKFSRDASDKHSDPGTLAGITQFFLYCNGDSGLQLEWISLGAYEHLVTFRE